eukprot:2307002-Rhodomonas_salina.1
MRSGTPRARCPVLEGTALISHCAQAMQCRPTIVWGNASEIVALAEACAKYEVRDLVAVLWG